jgi:hypothetical protein
MAGKEARMTRIISFILLVFVALIPFAHAEETYDITNCWSGEVTLLHKSENLAIFNFDVKGMSLANGESKAFDGWSLNIIGTAKVEAGKYSSTYYGIYRSPEGDIVVGEGTRTGGDGSWKFIEGTGKWKGISGGGTNKLITNVPPIKEGTTQSCIVATGTFELPK